MAIIPDLPMSEYLASTNVGNHQLKDFSVSPKLYFDKYVAHRALVDVDDDEDDDVPDPAAKAKEARARVLGIAFEMFMDDSRLFDKTYVQQPLVQPDGAAFKTTKVYGKAWLAEQKAAGKIPLKSTELFMFREMKAAFQENEEAVELLAQCDQQVTMTCHWPPADQSNPNDPRVTLQSRPDYVSLKGCALSGFRPFTVDLKTVDHMERMYSRRVIVEYGYDKQAEIARTCMRENGYPDSVHYILACEKSSPNRCVVFELEEDFLDACSDWVFNNCLDLAHCLEANEWPRSRSPGLVIAQKPAWKKADES
jgi:hypothetical protein